MTTYITQTRGLIGSSVLQKQSRLVRAARQQGDPAAQPLLLPGRCGFRW